MFLHPNSATVIWPTIHSVSTKPELKLCNALWHLVFRYKVNDKRLPGKPDIVLPKYLLPSLFTAVFGMVTKDVKIVTRPILILTIGRPK